MDQLFNHAKRIYFVGIKGVALSALALYFQDRGVSVCGSDVAEEFPTDRYLTQRKIRIYPGFAAVNVPKADPDVVIYTGAHNGRENPEVVEAGRMGIPVFPHGQALGMAMEGKRQIIVSGSHGKTTTSAMIAVILQKAGSDPSYAIGCGALTDAGPAGKYGKGEWFVAEGDEYITDPGHDRTPRFLWTRPEILVVTNIDFDHPDAYKTLPDVKQAFVRLQARQAGKAVTIVNADDGNSGVLLGGAHVLTYGTGESARYRIRDVKQENGKQTFRLSDGDTHIGEFELYVPGRHNVINASAAVIAGLQAGLSVGAIKDGLAAFRGTARRFEKLGEKNSVVFYDDYAHHPAEIRATLEGARSWYPDKRIIAVFQPHTYSRTKTLMEEFSRSFSDADIVILTDIYASAREHDTLGITGEDLVGKTRTHHAHAVYAPTPGDVRIKLAGMVHKSDCIIFMGAGDIYNWGRYIVQPTI